MRTDKAGALPALPEGYEVRENANGRVSIRRTGKSQLLPTEADLVRSALARLRPHGYRVDEGARCITILASAQDRESFAGTVEAEFAGGFAAALEELFARRYGRELAAMFRAKRLRRDGPRKALQFYPLLRFELADKARRTFRVMRIYFSGDQDWLPLEELSLPAAVMKYLPHLGRDSFFGLL